MTAVASPPSLSTLNRSGWINGGQQLNSMNPDEVRGMNMFMPRKTIQRTNSSSSIASSSSASSTSTVSSSTHTNGNPMQQSADLNGWLNGAARKRPQPKGQWPAGKPEGQADFPRMQTGRTPIANGINGASAMQQPSSIVPSQGQIMAQNGMARPSSEAMGSGRQPVLYLLSLNGTFERKTISVPFFPDVLRIGRQTNTKTVPTPVNGFFDSKVLSRQHAEIWADAMGKIWIRDVKSSNGTFVNGTRLSPENRESEAHELQTQDHLELGIDIVSEDQKTVVHHKVAAKVEHAGFLSPANNLMEFNFADLDPPNGGMMVPFGNMVRNRSASQASMGANGRMVPNNMMGGGQVGMAQQRQFWTNPVTADHIIKRLHTEMRSAKLQNQDLVRTGKFISNLLSKEDVKNQEKIDGPEAAKNNMANGNVSFRSDGGKARFSDPPAPPPSQPLPEKPDVAKSASDIPSLKRGTTERPKTNSASSSPVRPDNISQIKQLTQALDDANRQLDSHNARMKTLEEMLTKERQARLYAEDVIQKMEESNQAKANGAGILPLGNGHSELEKAFDPPTERPVTPEPSPEANAKGTESPSQEDKVAAVTAVFQERIDSMMSEMLGMREQLEEFKKRAEKAETERDADRRTLEEMVNDIRRQDEEKKRAAEQKSRPRSKGRSRPSSRGTAVDGSSASHRDTEAAEGLQADGAGEDAAEVPTLSRANTVTPSTPSAGALTKVAQDAALLQGLPYASMIGVVLIGMGLMAYLNGWQPQQRLDR